MESSRKQDAPAASEKRYTPEQLAAMPDVERVNYLKSLPREEYADLLAESLVKNLNAGAKRDNPD